MAKNYHVDVADIEAITEAINKQKVSVSDKNKKKRYWRWFFSIFETFILRRLYVNWKGKNRNSMNWLYCPRHWKPTETDKNYIAKVSEIDFIAKFVCFSFQIGIWCDRWKSVEQISFRTIVWNLCHFRYKNKPFTASI